MENAKQWLVLIDGETPVQFATLDEVVAAIHSADGRYDSLWRAVDFRIEHIEPDAASPTPKKRARRKRNSSPAPEQATPASSPVAAAAAQESGEVPAPAPASPVKAVLSCGGTRCQEKGPGVEVHYPNDPTCTWLRKPKRARA